MLLAIDIGNTNINFGLFKEGGLIKQFNIPASAYCINIFKRKFKKIEVYDIIICSVVPALSEKLHRDISKVLRKKPYLIGENIKVPIRNLYRYPKQVGQDRLVNAYAGIVLYGVPLIIVDFGTAITFDIISKNKSYLGGMIIPGAQISLDALYERTALLPKINLAKVKEFIGKDTKSSMLSGIVYGFSYLTDSLIEKIKKKIGKSAKIIFTGGNAELINKYCSKIDYIDNNLTLKGLSLIYNSYKHIV